MEKTITDYTKLFEKQLRDSPDSLLMRVKTITRTIDEEIINLEFRFISRQDLETLHEYYEHVPEIWDGARTVPTFTLKIQTQANYTEVRPWGNFENIADREDCKVKIITIKPGQSPSYQYHHRREEHWIVVSGTGLLRGKFGKRRLLPGEYAHIDVGDPHGIENDGPEDLIFIEVQLGDYFGEDDIVRLDDKYGRL